MYVFPVRDPDSYDLHQRPLSYWGLSAPESLAIGAGWTDGPPLSPPPAGIGVVGGYIPPLEHDEVEIVSLYFSSMLGDCTSVRARFDVRDGRIYYRVVNDGGWRYISKPECSRLPLTLEEVISLLDTMEDGVERLAGQDYFEQIWEEQWDSDPDSKGFVTVSSPFYPQLGAWYAEREEVWMERVRKALAEENGEEWGAS